MGVIRQFVLSVFNESRVLARLAAHIAHSRYLVCRTRDTVASRSMWCPQWRSSIQGHRTKTYKQPYTSMARSKYLQRPGYFYMQLSRVRLENNVLPRRLCRYSNVDVRIQCWHWLTVPSIISWLKKSHGGMQVTDPWEKLYFWYRIKIFVDNVEADAFNHNDNTLASPLPKPTWYETDHELIRFYCQIATNLVGVKACT